MAKINFRSGDQTFSFPNKTLLKAFIEKLIKKEGGVLSNIDYVFCSDEFLLQMNRDFLQHDYYTDIITFGLSEKNQPIEAEIYISIDRVKDNAKTLENSYHQEMLRVIFHGALHLCGFKDKTKSEISTMRAKEDQYLQLFAKSLK
ncbi:MAG: rRNA maturation RNase YbeY [Sphingobacteriia bacterium]|nr:MAG: rRNA maturation RNase YbeY [Sphingobacteriia bacterium]